MSDSPPSDPLDAVQERLLAGDRTAVGDLLLLLHDPLVDELRCRFPRTDEQLLSDAAIDALLEHGAKPWQYTPSPHGLHRFLVTAAWRNAANLCRGEGRLKARERKAGAAREKVVALDPAAGMIRQEERVEAERRRRAQLDALASSTDRAIWELRLEGVQETARFAELLKITDRSEAEQRRQVKQHKDRIARFLQRKGLLP
jgi:hypothetical protein